MSQDSSVSDYALDSWGLIPIRGKTYLIVIKSRPILGPTQPLIRLILRSVSPKVG